MDRGNGSGVLALFPFIEATRGGSCLSYEHVGQHGAANYTGCIAATVVAKPSEYAPLKRELETIGYVLEVRTRRPRKEKA